MMRGGPVLPLITAFLIGPGASNTDLSSGICNFVCFVFVGKFLKIWYIVVVMKDILISEIAIQVCSNAMVLEYICGAFTVLQFTACLANGPASICPNFKISYVKISNVFVQISNVFVQISKCICPTFKIYLSQYISLLCNLEHALQMARVAILPE